MIVLTVLFIILPLTFYLVFRTSTVQTFLTKKIAAHFSSELKTEIKIGGIDISFFLDIVLEDVEIQDLQQNNMFSIDKLVLDVSSIRFFKKQINIKTLELQNAEVYLQKYYGEEDFNFKFLIDYFKSEDEDIKTEPMTWNFLVSGLKLKDTHFIYKDHNKSMIEKGVDFNNIDIKDINLELKNITFAGDTVSAHIVTLNCVERSGLGIDELSGMVKFSPSFLEMNRTIIKTKRSDINFDLRFDYDAYDAFTNFMEDVPMEIAFKKTKLNLEDIAFFVPTLFGMDNNVEIDGKFSGTISNLKGKDVKISYGRNTNFSGNFSLNGLPDFENTFINFNAREFFTTISDLNKFALPNDTSSAFLNLPKELLNLGFIRFKGSFTGFINDFVAFGEFVTDAGIIRTDLSLKADENKNYAYKGNLAVAGFNMDKIVHGKSLGLISFDFKIDGTGFDINEADISLNGMIQSLVYNDYNYKNIIINGDLYKKRFEGYMEIVDENIDLDFEGIVDFSKPKPVFDFSSELNYIKLDKLHISDPSIPRTFSAFLRCRFKGSTIEDIGGSFLLSNVRFNENGKEIFVKHLHLTNTADSNFYKYLVLNSEVVDINIEGYFSYVDLKPAFLKYINNYLPSYKQDTLMAVELSSDTRFNYNIKIKKPEIITEFILPNMSVSEDFQVNGVFNFRQNIFTADAYSNIISLNNIKFDEWYLNIKPESQILTLKTGAKHVLFNNKVTVDDLEVMASSKSDSVLFDIEWFNKSLNIRNSGDINGFLSFESMPLIELKFLEGQVFINDSLWAINSSNQILFDSTAIRINDLGFSHNNQTIMLDGNLSKEPDNQLDVVFDFFDISDFNPLIKGQGVTFGGVLSGKISLLNVYNSMSFIANVAINNLVVNDDKLGNLILNSNWDKENNRIEIDSKVIYVGSIGENEPLKITGFYYPTSTENAFDLTFVLENFRIKLLQRYFNAFSSDFSGLATGTLNLRGTTKKPDLSGSVYLRRASLKVDYLNTTYTFANQIFIEKNAFIFNNITLNDDRKNKAILNGKILHKYFKNFELDLDFDLQNLMCLNTTLHDNDLFYGTAFASGLLRIYGPLEKITMDIQAKTERNTRFFLPLSGTEDVTEKSFVSFISHDTSLLSQNSVNSAVKTFEMLLNFDMEVTPDAEVQIIFDSQIGDIIRARGNGNIKMEISMNGDFNMYGDYIIDEGDYLFTLQNFINKRFKIDRGGVISWTGDPFLATTDLNAVYQVRTQLYDLFAATADTSEEYKKRVPVNCLLGLNGNLFNPDIKFDIDLPSSDENSKTLLKSIIDTDAEMNRQMFALLALNRFLPPGGLNEFSSISIATGLESTSTEMLSNQLSNWLSQISNDFDVGVNYRAGNEMTNDEVEVALSTQFFNDRLIVDGSVVTGSKQQNTSQIVGDVNVELKLTEDGKIRLKAYNKSNTFDMLKQASPYTQGIGLSYRREFDSLSELIKWRKRKKIEL
ncbi:MAG: translocation/assembly module TamB domain-containing protein [Bacteroidales bacterium]|nr:translocation/assembly module TamB domain-containing protein [Bacteroidales bacterium]